MDGHWIPAIDQQYRPRPLMPSSAIYLQTPLIVHENSAGKAYNCNFSCRVSRSAPAWSSSDRQNMIFLTNLMGSEQNKTATTVNGNSIAKLNALAGDLSVLV